MAYLVKVMPRAEKDIREIYEYIAYELKVPDAAFRVVERLRDAIASLSELPKRFRLYAEPPFANLGVHVMGVARYNVYYSVNDEHALVAVLRVIYQGRDPDKLSLQMVAEPSLSYGKA